MRLLPYVLLYLRVRVPSGGFKSSAQTRQGSRSMVEAESGLTSRTGPFSLSLAPTSRCWLSDVITG